MTEQGISLPPASHAPRHELGEAASVSNPLSFSHSRRSRLNPCQECMAGDPKYDLEQIRRWMQAVIVHPLGVEQGIASDDARQHVDVDAAGIERVVTRSKALSAVERLGIYGYAYYARLLECLKEEFPAVLHAVGEEAFDAFALGYLQKYPSRSYTLFELGANFPAISGRDAPDASIRPTTLWPRRMPIPPQRTGLPRAGCSSSSTWRRSSERWAKSLMGQVPRTGSC